MEEVKGEFKKFFKIMGSVAYAAPLIFYCYLLSIVHSYSAKIVFKPFNIVFAEIISALDFDKR